MAASKSTPPEIEFVDSCNDQIRSIDAALPEEALISSADAPATSQELRRDKMSRLNPAVLDMAEISGSGEVATLQVGGGYGCGTPTRIASRLIFRFGWTCTAGEIIVVLAEITMGVCSKSRGPHLELARVVSARRRLNWKCQSMARRLTESNMWEEAHGLVAQGVLTLLGLVVVAGPIDSDGGTQSTR